MLPERRSRWALRIALCCLLTFCGVTLCAAAPVSVSGQVVDTKGNPVPGVKVRLAVVARTPPFAVIGELSQTSRKSGEYSLSPVEVGEFDAIVVAVYEPGKWIGWNAFSPAMSSKEKRLVVSKPTIAAGVVVDEAGKPMPGVKVGYEWFAPRKASHDIIPAALLPWIHPLKTMVTGADGKYELPDVPTHMIVTPSASKEWYGPRLDRLGTDEGNKRIVMLPAGSVTGRVVSSDGRPCPGTMTSAYDQDSFVGPGYTNSDGVFRIDGLPSGSYEVALFPNDGPASSREGVQVKAGAVTDLGDIALPASVELSGRVLDAETGEPIRGAKVSARGVGFRAGETISGANGEYKLAAFAGEVTLYYEGGVPHYLGTLSDPVEVTVPAEGLHGYDIRLTKADQAHGRILSAAGKPVPGAMVTIASGFSDADAVADSSGRFTIAVPKEDPNDDWGGESEAGGHTVVLRAEESKPNGQGGFIHIKREKLIKNGVTITLAPPKSVSVSVVDKAGKPIAGAEVSMCTWIGGSGATGPDTTKRTDRRGRTSFSGVLKGGRYSFSVSCVGYNQFSDPGHGVDSSSAKWKPMRRIVMTRADLLKGTVVDGEGKPVVGATVTRIGYGDGRTATTDARGAFKLFLAPKGESGWTLCFEGDNDSVEEKIKLMVEDKFRNLGVCVSVERTMAIAKGVRLVLRPARELQVIVKDPSGKPIVGAIASNMRDIEYGMSFSEQKNGLATNADGVARLSVYEGMPVEATAEMKGYVHMGYSQSLPAAGSKEWTGKCEIILTPLTRTVEGQVVDTAGKPVKEASVSIALGQGTSISTDTEGRFKIDLPDSMVSLSVSSDSREGSANVGRDDKTVTIIVGDE